MNRLLASAAIILFFLIGCDQLKGLIDTESVEITDQKLEPFKSMYAVDRASLGFTELPIQGKIKIEKRYGTDAEHAGYDAMLHIYEENARTIAFRKEGDYYIWIGEQETFEGPEEIDTPDGKIKEMISISFYKKNINGGLEGFKIDYIGNDKRLAHRNNLTLKDIKPVIEEWKIHSKGH